MERKNEVWQHLKRKMGAKRAKSNTVNCPQNIKKEIVVQRLASEPDNKQTYKPIQPREFVKFEYSEMTLSNLKLACSNHFNLPARNCDVLVSNKGPSCSNISQLQMRKDKVYLVRFMVDSNGGSHTDSGVVPLNSSWSQHEFEGFMPDSLSPPPQKKRVEPACIPKSVSLLSLLSAGKFVKPVKKTRNVV